MMTQLQSFDDGNLRRQPNIENLNACIPPSSSLLMLASPVFLWHAPPESFPTVVYRIRYPTPITVDLCFTNSMVVYMSVIGRLASQR